MNFSYSHKLNKRIIIQQRTGSASSITEPETWTNFKTVYAGLDPLQGKAYFEANRQNTDVTIRIYIRYLAGITPDMRVKFGDRIFEIISIINIGERNKEMHLMCKEAL